MSRMEGQEGGQQKGAAHDLLAALEVLNLDGLGLGEAHEAEEQEPHNRRSPHLDSCLNTEV